VNDQHDCVCPPYARDYPDLERIMSELFLLKNEDFGYEPGPPVRSQRGISQQMRNIARAMTAREIDEASAYYASQPEIVKATD